MKKKLFVVAIASGCVACFATPDEIAANPSSASAGPKASSGFDADAEGWTVAGDAQATSTAPDYNGMGGNPGGLITAKDDTTGGVFYFVAPAKYLGNASSVFGKKLTFDLMTTSVASPFKAYGVLLSGGNTTVVALLPTDPTPANMWKSYSFALDLTGGWKLVSGADVAAESDFSKAPDASESQLKAVLSDLKILRIRGEFNDGPDTGALDNVRFGS